MDSLVFPHIFRDSYGSGMGPRGSMSWGFLENPTDSMLRAEVLYIENVIILVVSVALGRGSYPNNSIPGKPSDLAGFSQQLR